MQEVVVRVPASTSNLGPGFDCLGLALRLYNRVAIRRSAASAQAPLVREAAEKFFAATRSRRFEFNCVISGDIPPGRGLGSSAALRAGVLSALNELSGEKASPTHLFELCAELEGHPDNAAPTIFGGFTLVRDSKVQRFLVSPRLSFVLLVPDFEVQTEHARALLPSRIAREDAVVNARNVAAIAAAFASRDYPALAGAFADRLHQPSRRKLVPFLDQVIGAAEKAGALGGFLSGSGSAICAVTLHREKQIAAAMVRASRLKAAQILVTTADNRGARIVPATVRRPSAR